jgi:hypothetical protein
MMTLDRSVEWRGKGSDCVSAPVASAFPKVGAGGYTWCDVTVEFYGRVQAFLHPSRHVLDFGAGREAGLQDDPTPFRCGFQRHR